MRAAASPVQEWMDGFLFVANRPILDFLNTKPVLAGGPAELLPDVRALERWLIAAHIVASPRTKATLRRWRHSPEAVTFLHRLIAFREKLREAVLQIEGGSPPSDAFLAEVNALLLQHPLPALLHNAKEKFCSRPPSICAVRPTSGPPSPPPPPICSRKQTHRVFANANRASSTSSTPAKKGHAAGAA